MRTIEIITIAVYFLSVLIVGWKAIRTITKDTLYDTSWGILFAMIFGTFCPGVNSLIAMVCLPDMFNGMFCAIGEFLASPILKRKYK